MRNLSIAVAVLALAPVSLASVAATAGNLKGANAILSSTEGSASGGPGSTSRPQQLVADIGKYRAGFRTLAPEEAARQWFALFDRATELGAAEGVGDFASFDSAIGNVVSVHSMLASLPAPAAWPALRGLADARVESSPNDVRVLALRLLFEAWSGMSRP